MLDPRIYRAGLVAVALAVIVFAFSFQDQPGAAQSNLVPNAFNSQYAFSETNTLASRYPDRRPGSTGDDALAGYVARTFGDDGRNGAFTVSTDSFSARTAVGTRILHNVTATRTGSENGSILIVAPRDSLTSGSRAAASGTAMLLALANVLSGETLNHTIVLASISGSAGQAGAEQLAQSLPGPVDAVIVLGDMGSPRVRRPVVIPWSNGAAIAPMMLRNTIAGAISSQSTIKVGGTSLASQFVHLAFPVTITDQGPFNARGIPAVEVSASGERGPSANGPVSANQIAGLGQAVLASISALDSAAAVPAPSGYLLAAGKVIPPWAIRLFVLVLILPVLFAAVDGLARANRRRYPLADSAMDVVALTAPFLLVALVILGANVAGLLPVVPPDPTGPGAIPIHAANWVLIGVLAALLVGAIALVRWFGYGRLPARDAETAEPSGGAPLVPAVLCVVAIAIWVANPLAAALLVPALHLWLWLSDPELRLRPAAAVVLLVVGLAPMALVLTYYAISLGYGPGSLLWALILMLAGGHIGLIAAFEWCIALGCTACMVLAALVARRAPAPAEVPVTVRGPATYAGPGSLGGTESAIRR
jgi:Peptidase family M28